MRLLGDFSKLTLKIGQSIRWNPHVTVEEFVGILFSNGRSLVPMRTVSEYRILFGIDLSSVGSTAGLSK